MAGKKRVFHVVEIIGGKLDEEGKLIPAHLSQTAWENPPPGSDDPTVRLVFGAPPLELETKVVIKSKPRTPKLDENGQPVPKKPRAEKSTGKSSKKEARA